MTISLQLGVWSATLSAIGFLLIPALLALSYGPVLWRTTVLNQDVGDDEIYIFFALQDLEREYNWNKWGAIRLIAIPMLQSLSVGLFIGICIDSFI